MVLQLVLWRLVLLVVLDEVLESGWLLSLWLKLPLLLKLALELKLLLPQTEELLLVKVELLLLLQLLRVRVHQRRCVTVVGGSPLARPRRRQSRYEGETRRRAHNAGYGALRSLDDVHTVVVIVFVFVFVVVVVVVVALRANALQLGFQRENAGLQLRDVVHSMTDRTGDGRACGVVLLVARSGLKATAGAVGAVVAAEAAVVTRAVGAAAFAVIITVPLCVTVVHG